MLSVDLPLLRNEGRAIENDEAVSIDNKTSTNNDSRIADRFVVIE